MKQFTILGIALILASLPLKAEEVSSFATQTALTGQDRAQVRAHLPDHKVKKNSATTTTNNPTEVAPITE